MNTTPASSEKNGTGPASDRGKAGKFSGILGIALNILLAAAKIACGAVSGAVSVVADGLNNLTDCGSNVVSLIGFKVSEKPADKEHPFGHRRAETVAAMVIAVVVLAVAAELAMQSVERIFSGEKSDFSYLLCIVLGAAVAIKLFMFFFNRALAKKYDAETFKATATDSLSDAVATAAVLVSAIVSHYTGAELDGYMGAVVAVFIAFTGVSILKDTVSSLLGKDTDGDTRRTIREEISAFEGVQGVHDLLIHEYGPDKLYATAHVEVDSRMPLTETHDLADRIEKHFAEGGKVQLTVHIDPLVYGDERVDACRALAERAAAETDESLRVHDFRLVGGETHFNLVFEIAAPFDCALSDAEIESRVRHRIETENENFGAVITVERQNTD